MSGPRIGALFAGYGGLEMGVQSVLGGDLAWYSEIDKGALKILTHRHPDVPNVGDVTTADWSQVEPVDILTGGSPCQDLSHAGKRAGMTEGTRSNLWVAMREAIAQLRPGLVVWENVRGAYSAEADCDLEFCPGCMGDAWYRGAALRALGRVLGDLSDLGYDAGWHGLRAADVGATHGRMRVFVVAYPQREGRGTARDAAPGEAASGWAPAIACGPSGVADSTGPLSSCRHRYTTAHPAYAGTTISVPASRTCLECESIVPATDPPLLPTPAVNDMGAAYTPDEWDAWTDRMKAEHGNGNGHGKSLSIEAARLAPHTHGGTDAPECTPTGTPCPRLLPTPESSDGSGGRKSSDLGGFRESGAKRAITLATAIDHAQWGDYADAIARWEHTTGRPAPAPTMTSAKGNPQLAPAFVEWMMGLPAGWVTDTPGITRNEALKALGNGVVPQQAEAALRYLLAAIEVAA